MIALKDVLVFDDIIPKSYQDQLESQLLSPTSYQWAYKEDITFPKEFIREHNLMTSPVMSLGLAQGGEIMNSDLVLAISGLIHATCDRINFPLKQIVEGRGFLHFPLPEFRRREHNTPHVDGEFPHLVFLYYVIDSDGDTVVYNETIDDYGVEDSLGKEFTVKASVTPRKGRMIVFDGKHYHSSTTPAENMRCILNLNVI